MSEEWYALPDGGYQKASLYPGDPMAVPLNRERAEVKRLLVTAMACLKEPCHTSAYGAFHELDEALRRLLALSPNSDYGHSRWLCDLFSADLAPDRETDGYPRSTRMSNEDALEVRGVQ